MSGPRGGARAAPISSNSKGEPMSLNRVRGEAEIVIGDQVYRVALTMDVLARAADIYGEPDMTFSGFVARCTGQRIADMLKIIKAFLEGNGHSVSDEQIARANPMDFMALDKVFVRQDQAATPAKSESKPGNGRGKGA